MRYVLHVCYRYINLKWFRVGFSELSEGPAGEEGRKTSSAIFLFFFF